MPVPSLVSLAQRVCIRNLAGLQDVGDIEYRLVKPILKRIDNPQQLKEIEDASPQVADHDAELWKAFIARDIPNWQDHIIEPKNPRSWWKVYRKLLREEQKAKEAQEEQLRATMTGIDKQREENQTHYVQKVIAEPARQRAFVDGKPNPNVRCRGETVVVKKPALKNAKTGFQIMSAIRRQTANARAVRERTLAQPMILSPRNPISRAPQSMSKEHAAKPNPTPVVKRSATTATQKASQPPIAPTSQHKSIDATLRTEQAREEERLKALASGSSKAEVQTPKSSPTKPTTSSDITASQEAARPSKETASPALRAVADTARRLSPSPAPPLVRKRPATPVSVFMPTKRRKI